MASNMLPFTCDILDIAQGITKIRIVILTTNIELAKRDDKRFRPIFKLNILADSDYELVYTDDLDIAIAVTLGMVVIDECDKLLRSDRVKVKNWLDE